MTMTKENPSGWLAQERSRLGRELERLAAELLAEYGEATYSTESGEIRELTARIGEPGKEVEIGLTFWPTETKFDSIFVTSVSSGDPESKTCLIINRMTRRVTNSDLIKEATIPELTRHLKLLSSLRESLHPLKASDPI